VATSSFALTTSTVVAGAAGKCLVIDPGVTVAETAALAAELRSRGLTPTAAWSTHPHWDHVLWCRELGEAPRYAAPAAVQIAETERAGMVEGVQRSAPGHDLDLLGRLTVLDADAIAWDGPTAELIVHDGHAPGHGAVFLPEVGVLVAGDMCSDVEIPLLDTEAQDAFGDYRAGLAALAAVPGVCQVVPGHGHVGEAAEFRRRLAADSGYLDALALLEPFDDSRITEDWMREAHDSHLRYLRARVLPVPPDPAAAARPTMTATTTRIGISGAKFGPEETKPWCREGRPEAWMATVARPMNRAATTGARIPGRAAGGRAAPGWVLRPGSAAGRRAGPRDP
jgi:hydroxyacylglutathione hydrolase